jgi:hypothetical protein
MKKTVILALVALMMLGAAAFATNTRVLTMGENNNILLDEANVWLYPSRVNFYPNISSGEFSDGCVSNLGVNWRFNEKKPWVIGTYFSNGLSEYPQSYGGTRFGEFFYDEWEGPYSRVQGDRRADLLYGRKLGSLNFGLGLTYVNGSETPEDFYGVYELSYSRFGFTLGITPSNGNWDVAAYASFGTWKEEYVDTSSSAGYGYAFLGEPDGYNDFALRGRYFAKMNPTVTLVPHADIAFGKHTGVEAEAAVSPTGAEAAAWGLESKFSSFGAGCGMNYTPVTNVLAVLDFGLTLETVKEDFAYLYARVDAEGTVVETDSYEALWKKTTTILPYWKLGVEGEVFSWLDVRFGATSLWTRVKNEWTYDSPPITSLSKSNYADSRTYLGIGLHFNRLHIDTQVDPQLVLHGFDFITGSNGNYTGPNDMNLKVSVLYEFK